MKKILIAAAMILAGSAAQAGVITCHDAWGKPAHIKFYDSGAAIVSARYGKSSFLRANGESSSSFYYRSGRGETLIVEKSVIKSGKGRVTYRVEREARDGRNVWARYTCH